MGLAREGLVAGVDGRDGLGVDVDADDLVALVGELRGERQADLAEADDGDLHAAPVAFTAQSTVRPSRADWMHASATATVARPSRIVTISAATAEDGVAEVLVLDAQRLRLGDREAGAVALGDAAEGRHLVPLGGDQAVLVEGQVAVEGVGDERAALAGDDRDPLLERGQPVDEVADHGAVLHLRRDRDEVLVLAAALVRGLGGDLGVGRLDHPGRQVDVVGGQVLDHADVGDAVGERALGAAWRPGRSRRARRSRGARAARAARGCSARCGRRR